MKTEELTLQEAALAWAQKKKVLAAPEGSINWNSITPVGGGDGYYTANVFTEDKVQFLFRLAPEPPAKKWRPWKPEEVPVGAVMRWKTTSTHASLICSHGDSCVFPAGATQGTLFEDALEKWEYSIDPVGTPDNKRTWLPCGVEVSE